MVGSSTNQFYSQKSKQSRKVHVETCHNLSNFLANRSDADVKKDLKSYLYHPFSEHNIFEILKIVYKPKLS